jgi:type II secretory pathway component GspD/PulD (secretin)
VVNPTQQTLTPTISQRRVHSTVAVTSGQTRLLGGLISDQSQKTREGIPILNDIEAIGNPFEPRPRVSSARNHHVHQAATHPQQRGRAACRRGVPERLR